MTNEERIASLHARMNALEKKREKRGTAALGAVCAALGVCLCMLVFRRGGQGSTAGVYSGATMLFEDAGSYVLLAAAAFMAGVIVTAVCIRRRKKGEEQKKNE